MTALLKDYLTKSEIEIGSPQFRLPISKYWGLNPHLQIKSEVGSRKSKLIN